MKGATVGKFGFGWLLILAAMWLAPTENANGSDCVVVRVMGPVLNNACARPLEASARTGGEVQAPVAAQPKPEPEPEPAYTGLDLQKALNFFGMNAGREDGIVGRRTRGAVLRMQNALGVPRTGVLSDDEQEFLVESYRRAFANGRKGNRNMLIRLWQKRS